MIKIYLHKVSKIKFSNLLFFLNFILDIYPLEYYIYYVGMSRIHPGWFGLNSNYQGLHEGLEEPIYLVGKGKTAAFNSPGYLSGLLAG